MGYKENGTKLKYWRRAAAGAILAGFATLGVTAYVEGERSAEISHELSHPSEEAVREATDEIDEYAANAKYQTDIFYNGFREDPYGAQTILSEITPPPNIMPDLQILQQDYAYNKKVESLKGDVYNTIKDTAGVVGVIALVAGTFSILPAGMREEALRQAKGAMTVKKKNNP